MHASMQQYTTCHEVQVGKNKYLNILDVFECLICGERVGDELACTWVNVCG